MAKMAGRQKKPLIKPEKRREWLQRYEEGESPPAIAKADKVDARTVRKHIELARQETETKEARSVVLRNALERHYADLCGCAERLGGQATRSSNAHQDEYLLAALRQHLPRSPIWGYLNQRDKLNEAIAQSTADIGKLIEEGIKSDNRLARKLTPTESGVVPGIITALKFQVEQWAQGGEGLNMKDNLLAEPVDDEIVSLRYGFSQMGKVRKEHVKLIGEVISDWESRIQGGEEYRKLQKLSLDLRRIDKNLRDEIAVILLRRVVPGRCRYCPL